MTTKAIITTLDNLPILKEQVRILEKDSYVDEIVVVNNGSQDGTMEWLEGQRGLTVIHRENMGAGPGRNAGVDAAGEVDYYLFLDGGIRPLAGGTERMLEYLRREGAADVIGVEIPDFETDYERAWRRWPDPIRHTYTNRRLSHTAYCLTRRKCFDGLRFCEEGPFGEPGWGADDDEMAYQWLEAGITVHVVSCECNHKKPCTGVHPYRRGSGSFRRLFLETGVWPNQYGSVYERRVVWLQQNWPQYWPGIQTGEPWLTLVIRADGLVDTSHLVRRAHDELRKHRFVTSSHHWYPYSIVVWVQETDVSLERWIEAHALRQHHGDKVIVDGIVLHKDERNDKIWTGDFRVWQGENWRDAVRGSAFYYALVEDDAGLDKVLSLYGKVHTDEREPTAKEELTYG